MRILHIIQSLDPAAGGPPAVAVRLAAAQAQLGHDVALVSIANRHDMVDVAKSLEGVPGIDLVRRVQVETPAGLGKVLLVGPPDPQLLAAVRSTDFVHIHGVWEPILRWAAHLSAEAGVPYAITPHGMLDPWCLGQKRFKKQAALVLGYRRMLDRASFIHVLNEDEARLLTPLRLKAPTRTIPNGIFLEEVDPLPEPGRFRRSHSELHDRPFILFLGRLHYKKGLDYLAAAFAEVAAKNDRVHLVVAGPDGGAEDGFRRDVQSAGLANRVHLVGSIYGRAKYEAMVDAACFCLPSRQEGFSIAITEALACGLPVVISENCHFPEVAEAGAGKVTPLDATAIAEALVDVARNETARAAMGDAGRRLVAERYTWPVIAKRMVKTYRGDRE